MCGVRESVRGVLVVLPPLALCVYVCDCVHLVSFRVSSGIDVAMIAPWGGSFEGAKKPPKKETQNPEFLRVGAYQDAGATICASYRWHAGLCFVCNAHVLRPNYRGAAQEKRPATRAVGRQRLRAHSAARSSHARHPSTPPSFGCVCFGWHVVSAGKWGGRHRNHHVRERAPCYEAPSVCAQGHAGSQKKKKRESAAGRVFGGSHATPPLDLSSTPLFPSPLRPDTPTMPGVRACNTPPDARATALSFRITASIFSVTLHAYIHTQHTAHST